MSLEHFTVYQCDRCKKEDTRKGLERPRGWVVLMWSDACQDAFEGNRFLFEGNRFALCSHCEPHFKKFLQGASEFD